MGPLTLIDVSHIQQNIRSLAWHEGEQVGQSADESPVHGIKPRNERRAQIHALVAGTLLFLPILAGYLALCANR